MAKKKKSSTPKAAEPKAPYLTKRVVVRAINKGSKELTSNAIKTQGYLVKLDNGWVVKIDANGKILKRISKVKRNKSRKINLD